MTVMATAPAGQTPAHPASLTCWGDAEDESTLVCRQVRDVTHDVRTFTFASEGAHLFHYDPGQFVTLRLSIDGVEVMRSYTISSPPTRPHLLSITVKRKVGGVVSNWLHDNVRPGTRLRVQPPLGAFSISRHPARKYLFLSAGSGITPLMSMTRTLVDLGSDADVLFVHSARTPADIIFRAELDALEATNPNLRVVSICAADSADEVWTGHRGLLDRATLTEIAPDLLEREVFTCGPAPYMDAVRTMLAEVGFDLEHYHQETFSFENLGLEDFQGPVDDEESAEPEVAAAPAAGSHAVEFTRSGRTIECAPDETILEAAFRAGMSPPSSCSEGVCGTCKTVLLTGEVDMQHKGGIRPREIAAGKVLICCSRPLGNVSLDA